MFLSKSAFSAIVSTSFFLNSSISLANESTNQTHNGSGSNVGTINGNFIINNVPLEKSDLDKSKHQNYKKFPLTETVDLGVLENTLTEIPNFFTGNKDEIHKFSFRLGRVCRVTLSKGEGNEVRNYSIVVGRSDNRKTVLYYNNSNINHKPGPKTLEPSDYLLQIAALGEAPGLYVVNVKADCY